jgi:hypothetical protein
MVRTETGLTSRNGQGCLTGKRLAQGRAGGYGEKRKDQQGEKKFKAAFVMLGRMGNKVGDFGDRSLLNYGRVCRGRKIDGKRIFSHKNSISLLFLFSDRVPKHLTNETDNSENTKHNHLNQAANIERGAFGYRCIDFFIPAGLVFGRTIYGHELII